MRDHPKRAHWQVGQLTGLFSDPRYGLCAIPILIFLFIAGCSGDFSAPEGQDVGRRSSALFHTDSSVYHLVVTPQDVRVMIPATLQNTTGAPLYLWLCGPSAMSQLQKRVGDGWQVAWRPGCLAVYRPPIKVPVGATYFDTAEMYLLRSPHSYPFSIDTIPGTYRAVYTVSLAPDPDLTGIVDQPAPESLRTSNAFTIER